MRVRFSRFKAFCRENGYQTSSREERTHTTMDGLVLKVTPETERAFLERYAQAIFSPSDGNVFLVELKTPVFKFFMDFDYWNVGAMTELDRLRLLQVFQAVMRELYPHVSNRELRVIVGTTEPKVKGGLVKTGLHLVWPGIATTTENAMVIRAAMLTKCKTTEAISSLTDNWEEAIDECVYRMNGIRMFGSAKCSTCTNKACKAEKRARDKLMRQNNRGRAPDQPKAPYVPRPSTFNCEDCGNGIFIDEGRIYAVGLVLDGNGYDLYDDHGELYAPRLDHRHSVQSALALVLESTIRLPQNVQPTKICVPAWLQLESATAKQNAKAKAKTKRAREGGCVSADGVDVPGTEGTFDVLQLELNRAFADVDDFADCAVTRATKYADDTGVKYYKLETYEHYCLNKRGDHNGSHVYFIVAPSGITQRCHCTRCSGYRSDSRPLASGAKVSLFPAKHKTAKTAPEPALPSAVIPRERVIKVVNGKRYAIYVRKRGR